MAVDLELVWKRHSQLVETIRCDQRGDEPLMSKTNFESAVADLNGWKPVWQAPKDGSEGTVEE